MTIALRRNLMFREGRDYYAVSGVSAEDVIDGLDMLHREGAALKYLFRCNNIMPKGDVEEDMKKCKHYLHRCLKYTCPPVRSGDEYYWISKINPEVFDTNIHSAICYLIEAVCNPAEYKEGIKDVIYHVDLFIEQY